MCPSDGTGEAVSSMPLASDPKQNSWCDKCTFVSIKNQKLAPTCHQQFHNFFGGISCFFFLTFRFNASAKSMSLFLQFMVFPSFSWPNQEIKGGKLQVEPGDRLEANIFRHKWFMKLESFFCHLWPIHFTFHSFYIFIFSYDLTVMGAQQKTSLLRPWALLGTP